MSKSKTIHNYHLFLNCIFIFLFSGCKDGNSQPKKQKIESENKLFTFQIGNHNIKAELAVLPKERQRGLMFRKRLKEGEGMLFIFEKATAQKFWMKNTKIPLDIGYISSDGKLREVHAAKPFDLSGVPSRSQEIQFVLEMNIQGFRKKDIRIGDHLNLNDVRKALQLRGFNPENYNINPYSSLD